MELMEKQGYKQTEVGLIPEDWDYIEFGKLISNLCYGPRFSSNDYAKDGNVKTIRGTDISLLGDILYEQVPIAKLPKELVNEHKLVEGDLVMITTADCGLTGVYFDDGFPFIASAYAVRITLNQKAYPLFFKYIYQTQSAKKQIELYIRKGTVGNLPGSDVYKFKFPLPQTLEEQKAIATALSDVDELITNLDQLITKKKSIKQGAIQQLLTPPHKGGKRLEGYTGEWEEKVLGRIGNTFGGLSGKTKTDFENGKYPYITFLNVMNNTIIDSTIFEYVNIKSGEQQNKARKGDLFFNTSSETPEEVGMCAILKEEVKDLYLNSFCFGFRLKEDSDIDGLLFSYLINSPIGRNLFLSLAQGATRYNLSKSNFNKLIIEVPPLKEQKAIAQILFDIDEEIKKLESKKSKCQSVKQGMMQELLTGKTRLI